MQWCGHARPSRLAPADLPFGPWPHVTMLSSPVVREAASDVYVTDTRGQRVDEGIASYEAVLRLMLGTRLGPDWPATVY